MKANGGSTAWSDKHTAAYRWLQGAANTSVDTYYSPEVASLATTNMSYAAYDKVKVRGGRRTNRALLCLWRQPWCVRAEGRACAP